MNPAQFPLSSRAALLGFLLLVSLAFPAGVMAAPPLNDNRSNPGMLDDLDASNTQATTQPGETLQ